MKRRMDGQEGGQSSGRTSMRRVRERYKEPVSKIQSAQRRGKDLRPVMGGRKGRRREDGREREGGAA